ncbi:hypothetical protein [Rickettsia endosymbiont of Orchestes rusci]|uniref:hypothetical protein n=1 Tax=Rickettsia endosymbiont of Orchestes rusci TaxID=3066250 RepID=UPI00313F03D4
MNSHLIKIILDIVIFLEFSNEDIINDDSAIQMMESIAYELQKMEESHKNDFIKKINELANEYKDEQKVFVQTFAYNWGLIEK